MSIWSKDNYFLLFKGAAMKLLILSAALWTLPAYAYLDPATGGFIIQGLVAIIAGAAMAGKLYWSKIKAFFKRFSGR